MKISNPSFKIETALPLMIIYLMKTVALFALIALFDISSLSARAQDYPELKAKAEAFYSDGSYARAEEAYQQAKTLKLSSADRRWVEFRLADTLWRSEAGTHNADSTRLDKARKDLEVLIRDIDRVEDHDRVWVEVEESLGDYYWTRRESRNWGSAWPHYQLALDWWAGAADVELARARYLKMVWTLAKPPQVDQNYYYGDYGQLLPLEILENASTIAQTETDRAHAHYLLAMTLQRQNGDWEQHWEWSRRVPEEFDAALKPGKATDWYDDALFQLRAMAGEQWPHSCDEGRQFPAGAGLQPGPWSCIAS